jgi:hypothetical protein
VENVNLKKEISMPHTSAQRFTGTRDLEKLTQTAHGLKIHGPKEEVSARIRPSHAGVLPGMNTNQAEMQQKHARMPRMRVACG